MDTDATSPVRAGAPALGTVTVRCPQDLTPAMEEWLTNGLVEALPSMQMRELFDIRLDMFREADLVTVAVDGERVVGALASRWARCSSGDQIRHITSQFVADRYRHGAVFRMSWRCHFTEVLRDGAQFPRLIALKTYNPVVYCAMRAFARAPQVQVYPMIGTAQDSQMMAVATRVATAIAPGGSFHPETGLVRSAGSPPGLYPAMPESRDPAVNAYFAATLQRSDRLLCFLTIPTAEGANVILDTFGVAR